MFRISDTILINPDYIVSIKEEKEWDLPQPSTWQYKRYDVGIAKYKVAKEIYNTKMDIWEADKSLVTRYEYKMSDGNVHPSDILIGEVNDEIQDDSILGKGKGYYTAALSQCFNQAVSWTETNN